MLINPLVKQIPLSEADIEKNLNASTKQISLYEYLESGTSDDDAVEAVNSMQDFIHATSCLKLIIPQNFSLHKLSGPSYYGFSMLLDSSHDFCLGAVLGKPYRFITMVEIKPPATSEWSTPEKIKKKQDDVRKALPLISSRPPTVQAYSDATHGWAPSLGVDGSIGIYKTQVSDDVTGEVQDKFYIICNCGAPYQFVDEVNERSFKILNDNLSYHQQLTNTKTVNNRISNAEEFAVGGPQERFRGIALENARRLIVMFADIVDVAFKNQEVETHANAVTVKTQDMLCQTPNPVLYKNNQDTLLFDALEWWPKGVMIYPYTVIPKYDDKGVHMWNTEAKSIRPDPKLYGYCIGTVLKNLFDGATSIEEKIKKGTKVTVEDEDVLKKFKALIEKHEVKFSYLPLTLPKADIETDYNTYRVQRDGNIVWYNMCTSTIDFKNGTLPGLLVQSQFTLGYYCFEYGSLHNNLTKDHYSHLWYNSYLNTFPCVFPFEKDINKTYTPEETSRMFSQGEGGVLTKASNTLPPKHTQGFFKRSDLVKKNDIVKRELGGVRGGNLEINELRPYFLYCGPAPHATSPTFELI